MKELPLVSVIIPCYNYGDFLPDTLENLLEQSYQNWECIVIDDGSTDCTKDVCIRYVERDARFIYLNQDNKGPNAARNTGLTYSKGKYIQLLDADDFIEKKKFEAQVDFLENNPEVDIVYADVKCFKSDAPDCFYNFEGIPVKIYGSGRDIVLTLLKGNIVTLHSPLFKKDLIEDIGYFDESLRTMEDWDFWLRCALNNKFFFYLECPETLAKYRIHSKSASHNYYNMLKGALMLRHKINNLVRLENEYKKLNEMCSENDKEIYTDIIFKYATYTKFNISSSFQFVKLSILTGSFYPIFLLFKSCHMVSTRNLARFIKDIS